MARKTSLTGVINAAKAWDARALRVMLAENPAFAAVVDKTKRTPLHYVASVDARTRKTDKASVSAAKVLIDFGADINAVRPIPEDQEVFPATPLWTAYARGHNLPLLKWLLKQGADPNHTLWAGGWLRDVATAHLLLKHGAEIDPLFHGMTPFFEAVSWRRVNFAAAMAKAGADVDFRGPGGETVLHIALRKNFKVSEFELVLKLGTNPELRNDRGESAPVCAKRLRKAGALKLMQ